MLCKAQFLDLLVNIKDLPKSLHSNVKLFDPEVTTEMLNEDLTKIFQWTHYWKMLLNPDSSKQAQELHSLGRMENSYRNISFNNMLINGENVLKH